MSNSPHLLWFWNTWARQFEAIELTDIAENGTNLRSGDVSNRSMLEINHDYCPPDPVGRSQSGA